MTRAAGLVVVLGAATLPFATPSVAQEAFANFTPVTDAMLANPGSGRLADVAAHVDNWGYSPLEQINRRNVAQLSLVWSRPLADGSYQEGTPLVHDGILFFPNPFDVTQALNAATGDLLWEYRRKVPEDVGEYFPAAEHQPQSRDLRQSDPRQRRRRLCLRAECAHRRARLGNAHPRLPHRREEQLRSDHRQRQSHLGQELRARGRPRSVRHHGLRCEDRPRGLAPRHDSEARRARRRNLGRHSIREALARRHVDGAELRSRS